MQSLWNDADARPLAGDPLLLRVYTSRLLGQEPGLVLHGGGNTSVKGSASDLFGNQEPVLFVKGSGWDLSSIRADGFAPVKLSVLTRMAELPHLSDGDMVRAQRAAMTDPAAPTPSVEAILHAIIPFAYVDHTHADAVVTISNTPHGPARIREIYGPRVLVVPYVMPGFVLARKVFEMTRGLDWATVDGIILLHHGVFTFGPDARSSYERMIALVTRAESFLDRETTSERVARKPGVRGVFSEDPELAIARLRFAVSRSAGRAMLASLDPGEEALLFSCFPLVREIAKGPLTPDHVIRTKPLPLMVEADVTRSVERYAAGYREYFERNAKDGMTPLDPAPRWAIWPGRGTAVFGTSWKEVSIVGDIVRHTRQAILAAESLGGWRPLGEADLFEVEYWELEQAKLKQSGLRLPLEGKIAVVTGAASGIGRACVELLLEQGAAVSGLDIDPRVETTSAHAGYHGQVCDVTDSRALDAAVRRTVARFGGIDHLISNAGAFTPSMPLDQLEGEAWTRSLDLNLSSHQALLRSAIPFLRLGVEASVVIIGSKNVPAPGPGAGAYSVAKAGLTQLARVAALELARDGIRVNVIHPHAVFDTAAWSAEVLEERARSYGISVEEYKAKNLLGVEITSRDVAGLALAMLGPAFGKTTGAQVPIDGGNERVI